MERTDTLLRLVPEPPDWTIPWDALEHTAAGGLLSQLAQTLQNPAFHGEGDVLTHTKMVCRALAGLEEFRHLEERQRQAVFLAALFHDVGKIRCTRRENGTWSSPRHAAVGAGMVRELLWLDYGWCGRPDLQQLRETVCTLILRHSLPPHAAFEEDGPRRLLKAAADGELLPGFTVELLCLLSKADILGRICAGRNELLEAAALCALLAEELGCLRGPGPFPSQYAAFSYFSGQLDRPDVPLYDDTWGEVVLLSGLPGTGKDAWIASHCPQLPVVSLDAVRAELGLSPAGPQKRVAGEAQARARALLRERKAFVWNATSITASLRRQQVDLFTRYRARVRIVYLETAWSEQLRRNADRSAVVPEPVIRQMLDRLAPPERFEAHRVEWHCI